MREDWEEGEPHSVVLVAVLSEMKTSGARGEKGILTLQDAIQMPPPQEVFQNVPSPFLNSSTLGLSMSGGN